MMYKQREETAEKHIHLPEVESVVDVDGDEEGDVDVECRGRGDSIEAGRLVAVDHLDRAAFFAVGPHRPSSVRARGTRHAELRYLSAVLASGK